MQDSLDIERRSKIALAQPWWRSKDPVLLHLLEERNADQNRRFLRWGMWLGTIASAAFIGFDIYFLPDVSPALVTLRLAVLVFGIAIIEIGLKRVWSVYNLQLISAVALLIDAFGFLVIALQSIHTHIVFNYSIFATIFVLAVNLFFNFRFSLTILSSGLITMAYVLGFVFWMDVDIKSRIVNASFFVTTFLLSIYLSWRTAREHYTTFLHQLQAEFQERVAFEKGEQLKKIADTDQLTGLFNRRAVSREFRKIVKQGLSENEQIGVILAGIDYFGEFTERFGQNAADECLIRIAETLARTASAGSGLAIAGRYATSEFVVLCKVASEDDLRLIARQLCQAVEHQQINHPARGDNRKTVTISAGATMTHNDGSMDLTLLLQQADRALYAAKFTERSTFSVFDPENTNADPSGENLTELLKVAVSRRRAWMVYQPILDCQTGKLKGHESLMRLRDFDGSPISPAVFIPVAEQTGAIVELGLWAIDQACGDMAEHGLGDVVSVNVSAIQLKTPDFPDRVEETLKRWGLNPARLAVEVTEGIDILMETQVKKNIEALGALGVQVWLDDFGTGFAGLAWLRQFDFDVVKIDRAFLNDTQTPQGYNFFQDMVRLIRNLGLSVLAEGVETAEQRELLKRVGVNTMQGYFLGRPLPIEEILAARG